MNLRWERHLGTHVLDIASLATTRESDTRLINNLESIQESSSTDSHFDTLSQVESKMNNNYVDMNQDSMSKGKQVDNLFNDM